MMILAVFRSRTHSLDYLEQLQSYGVPATSASAPKEARIGCGLCAKNCPENAITMVNNLPIIDYSKCTGCKTCVNKCPRKCIKEI